MRSRHLKRLASFFAFELPVNYKYLYTRFCQTHKGQRGVYSSWPAEATRLQLISDYWRNAVLHYLLLIGLSALAVFPLSPDGLSAGMYFRMLVILAILFYAPLYFMIYRPSFNIEFLPKLETVIAEYEGRERAWLEKCKQDQSSTRALALLFYVLDKTSKMSYLGATSKCADMLQTIFGKSLKGMQSELDLIYKADKRKKISTDPRKVLEVWKGFDEAFTLLEDMRFTEGVRELKILEQRFKEDFTPKPKA